MANKCELVRSTCSWVTSLAKHVKINRQRLPSLAERFQYKPFNQDTFHQTLSDPEKALMQLFVLDCLNFCFWPLSGFEYADLATHVQKSMTEGLTLNRLISLTQEELISEIFHGTVVPLASQRARILRQLGRVVTERFQGSFVNVVEKANKSAVNLLNILTQNFPNFQDHSIYQGRQIHFYKRPQILIGDIFGKFNGQGLGKFDDIHELTMFPDYRVPQILEAQGILAYSQKLKSIIYGKQQITDRQLQSQIRAASVVAVEQIRNHLLKKGSKVTSIQIDWFLWQLGQTNLSSLPPHHRCLTIYY